MPESFVFTFPVYSMLVPDGSGVLYLGSGQLGLSFLPLFTDLDGVRTYLERSPTFEAMIIELKTKQDLLQFLKSPPTRLEKSKAEIIIIDPIQAEIARLNLWRIEHIITSLESEASA
jgi:hypothetical protein